MPKARLAPSAGGAPRPSPRYGSLDRPMARLTPEQLRRRDRIEALIALAAPVLDGVLAVSDRISRVLGPESDYYPIRPASEAFELPPPGARQEPERDEPERPGPAGARPA